MFISINKAVDEIKNHHVIIVPTETVYGLAGLANSEQAVEKIFKIKNRPKDNPLICHFHSYEQILKFTENHPKYFKQLIKQFSPGPVSYLLKLKQNSDLKIATLGSSNVVCRIPSDNIFLEILKKTNYPIAAPSANLSTKFSGTNINMFNDIKDKVSGIVKGKKSKFGVESTILNCLKENTIEILRPGIIGKQELESFFKSIDIKNIKIVNQTYIKEVIPGGKYKHYSPKTPVYKFSEDILKKIDNIVILGKNSDLKMIINHHPNKNIKPIYLGQNHNTIAKNLFEGFWKLDTLNIQKAYFVMFELDLKKSVDLALENRISKVLIS